MGWWRSLILPNPAGWGRRTSARLEKILDDSNAYIQKLNDEYTNPSGNATVDPAIRPSGLGESRRPVLSQDESENTLQDNPGPATMDNWKTDPVWVYLFPKQMATLKFEVASTSLNFQPAEW